MKLLNKLVITFFITISVIICSYFFMPIKPFKNPVILNEYNIYGR